METHEWVVQAYCSSINMYRFLSLGRRSNIWLHFYISILRTPPISLNKQYRNNLINIKTPPILLNKRYRNNLINNKTPPILLNKKYRNNLITWNHLHESSSKIPYSIPDKGILGFLFSETEFTI